MTANDEQRRERRGSRPPQRDVEQSMMRARQGSGTALGQILAIYREYLLHIANEQMPGDVGAKVAPSDVVQDTLFEAARDFRRFSGNTEADVRAWLRQVLLNNLRNTHRHFGTVQKRAVSREVSLDGHVQGADALHLVVNESQCPVPTLLADEREQRVRAALAMLPQLDRDVIELRTFQGLTFEIVGQMTGRSADAARKVWARAIERLSRLVPELE